MLRSLVGSEMCIRDRVMMENYEEITHTVDPHDQQGTSSSLNPDDLDTEKKQDLNNYSPEQMEQFRYVKLCEMWQEQTDKDLNWTPIQITKHFINKCNKDDIHACIKVAWLNGETSIQRLLPFTMEHPDLVVAYAVNNDLQDSRPFRWTQTYQHLDRKDVTFGAHATSETKSPMASKFSAEPK